jgi:hypothetical protein
VPVVPPVPLLVVPPVPELLVVPPLDDEELEVVVVALSHTLPESSTP